MVTALNWWKVDVLDQEILAYLNLVHTKIASVPQCAITEKYAAIHGKWSPAVAALYPESSMDGVRDGLYNMSNKLTICAHYGFADCMEYCMQVLGCRGNQTDVIAAAIHGGNADCVLHAIDMADSLYDMTGINTSSIYREMTSCTDIKCTYVVLGVARTRSNAYYRPRSSVHLIPSIAYMLTLINFPTPDALCNTLHDSGAPFIRYIFDHINIDYLFQGGYEYEIISNIIDEIIRLDDVHVIIYALNRIDDIVDISHLHMYIVMVSCVHRGYCDTLRICDAFAITIEDCKFIDAAITFALSAGDLDIAKLLIDCGATPPTYIDSGAPLKCIKYGISMGMQFEEHDVLQRACYMSLKRDAIDEVKFIHALSYSWPSRIDVGAFDQGYHYELGHGQLTVLYYAFSNGAIYDSRYMRYSIWYNDVALFTVLLQLAIAAGRPVLFDLIIQCGRLDMLKIALKNGFTVPYGATSIAARYKQTHVLEFVVANGGEGAKFSKQYIARYA